MNQHKFHSYNSIQQTIQSLYTNNTNSIIHIANQLDCDVETIEKNSNIILIGSEREKYKFLNEIMNTNLQLNHSNNHNNYIHINDQFHFITNGTKQHILDGEQTVNKFSILEEIKQFDNILPYLQTTILPYNHDNHLLKICNFINIPNLSNNPQQLLYDYDEVMKYLIKRCDVIIVLIDSTNSSNNEELFHTIKLFHTIPNLNVQYVLTSCSNENSLYKKTINHKIFESFFTITNTVLSNNTPLKHNSTSSPVLLHLLETTVTQHIKKQIQNCEDDCKQLIQQLEQTIQNNQQTVQHNIKYEILANLLCLIACCIPAILSFYLFTYIIILYLPFYNDSNSLLPTTLFQLYTVSSQCLLHYQVQLHKLKFIATIFTLYLLLWSSSIMIYKYFMSSIYSKSSIALLHYYANYLRNGIENPKGAIAALWREFQSTQQNETEG